MDDFVSSYCGSSFWNQKAQNYRDIREMLQINKRCEENELWYALQKNAFHPKFMSSVQVHADFLHENMSWRT
jgi:hypothetical protein